jgi:rhamnogalacturonan endolyase
MTNSHIKLLFILFFISSTSFCFAQKQVEHLNRGLIALKYDDKHVFLSWRLLAGDPAGTGFNIFREQKGQRSIKLNKFPLTAGTNYTDSTANLAADNTWYVEPVNNPGSGKSRPATILAGAASKQYFSVPIRQPAGGTLDGLPYTYNANDASVADLDGDGEYEIILKWDPTNAKNPPQTGFTANQIIDAYKMDGTRLWRIDLGKNIRSGAAYTQLLAYDFDGDGKAELITKTADGTVDGQGKVLGDGNKDWRTYDKASGCYGKIVNGPEYLTVFEGKTGAALATVSYVPDRYPLNGWGGTGGNGGNDSTGGRSDRFTAGVAYLDGIHPSAFFVRGWYGRTVIAAWDWKNGKLSRRWVFDSKNRENPYSGMANHSVSVADMDGDGKDEICVGAMVVDDNGQGLYTTGFGHGDALHVAKMDPESNSVQVFGIHEIEDTLKTPPRPGVALFDAATGKVRFAIGRNIDVGRGVAADIDPRHPGFENWGGPGGLRDLNGKTISDAVPSSTNFVVWWDGDLTRELLDKNRIDKWDWNNNRTVNLLTATDCVANNGTKATPSLSADLFGDWREEVMWRTKDNKELRIYSTVIPTAYRFTSLVQDPQYRTAVAGQNVGYNQPPHPGFYLGAGMRVVFKEQVTIVKQKQDKK